MYKNYIYYALVSEDNVFNLLFFLLRPIFVFLIICFFFILLGNLCRNCISPNAYFINCLFLPLSLSQTICSRHFLQIYEHVLFYLFFLSISVLLSFLRFLYLFGTFSLSLSVCLRVCVSFCLSLYVSFCLSDISLSAYFCSFICVSICESLCLCISLFLSLFISLSLFVYLSFSHYLSHSLIISLLLLIFPFLSLSLSFTLSLCSLSPLISCSRL